MNTYHRVGLLVAGFCIGAAAASNGYLSAAGPAPLRFRPKAAAVGKSTLPPLPVPTAEAPVSAPPEPINSNATTTVSTAESPAEGSEPPAAAATNEFELTPQMLVDIFRSRADRGNSHDTRVLVPFGFVPPAGQVQPAGAGATSKATYRIE